jgi:hypothetical protein
MNTERKFLRRYIVQGRPNLNMSTNLNFFSTHRILKDFEEQVIREVNGTAIQSSSFPVALKSIFSYPRACYMSLPSHSPLFDHPNYFLWNTINESLLYLVFFSLLCSPPSSAEVKERVELYLHSPNTPSWRRAQLKHRDSFTFTFTFSFLSLTVSYIQTFPQHPILKHSQWMSSQRIIEQVTETDTNNRYNYSPQ